MSDVKITKVETICLSRMHEPERQWLTAKYRTVKADCAIVVIQTDAGVSGIGEACAYGNPNLIQKMVQKLAPVFLGRDPRDPCINLHPNGRSRGYDCAVAGIDAALWDIRGKLSGKRVSELLSSEPITKVRLYASGGCSYDWSKRPEQLIEEALEYMKEGYTAFKFRLGTHWDWDGVTVDRMLGLIRELSQEVDGRMELMLDGNQRLTEEQALEIGEGLDRIGAFKWFEEPIDMHNIEGYAKLNAALETPVSGGEQYTTVEQFIPYLDSKAYSIIQQDVGLCGITEGMKIAAIGDAYGVPTIPHNWHNGLMTMANAHMVAALSKPIILELCRIQGPLQWEILKEKPVIRNGYLELPESPGLGIELADNLEQEYPFIEGHYAIVVEK